MKIIVPMCLCVQVLPQIVPLGLCCRLINHRDNLQNFRARSLELQTCTVIMVLETLTYKFKKYTFLLQKNVCKCLLHTHRENLVKRIYHICSTCQKRALLFFLINKLFGNHSLFAKHVYLNMYHKTKIDRKTASFPIYI